MIPSSTHSIMQPEDEPAVDCLGSAVEHSAERLGAAMERSAERLGSAVERAAERLGTAMVTAATAHEKTDGRTGRLRCTFRINMWGLSFLWMNALFGLVLMKKH